MSIIYQDSFDHYGEGSEARLVMLDGVFAEITAGMFPDEPLIGARTGQYAMFMAPGAGSGNVARYAFPLDTYTEVFVHLGLYMPALPVANGDYVIASLRTAANAVIANLSVASNGALIVTDGASVEIGNSDAPVLSTGAFNHIAFRLLIGAGTGAIEVRVNKVTVITETALALGSTEIGQIAWVSKLNVSNVGFYVDDVVINNTLNGINNTWLGDPRCATMFAKADDADESGWTPQPRYKFGNGVLQLDGATDGITMSDSADFEFGTGDFTMECFVKFVALPTGSNKATLFAKWRESTNERSYELFLGGPSLNNSQLQFRVSTDGTGGTVDDIVSVECSPVIGHYHHFVVQRESGEVVLFMDGVALNAPAADANNYSDNASLFCVGGLQSGASSILADTSINGFVEEVRVTKSVARYNAAGFTPPSTAHTRGVGDAEWSNVVLLAGFDSGLIDESSFGRAITARGDAARLAVDDALPGDYKTINQHTPRDDTFMEAPYIAASAVLTLAANAANNDTVTVDDNTYTFKTALTGGGTTPGEVLIGADADASLDNLAAAINGDAGAGTLYGTGTTASDEASAFPLGNGQLRVEANTAGTAGNAIDVAETLSNGAWTGSTLAGGTDIPGPSAFAIDRLPSRTTGVRAITLVTRSRKTDSGDCNVQASFVTADDSSANGADRPLTTAFTNYADIIEEDPSTTNPLTPATFVGARVRIDRTL